MTEVLRSLFLSVTGTEPSEIFPLKTSGSHRRYFRLSSGDISLIGVAGTDPSEDNAFITEARHFRSHGINVPEIIAVSEDSLAYLQEDLGDGLLFDLVAQGRLRGAYSEDEMQLLCKAMAGLPKIQFEGAEGLDFSICYPDREFNARMVDFDLNYFKYCFLKTSKIEFDEVRLQDDFDAFKADLLSERSDAFMYRDFQARNVMIRDGKPWYIDFQGGRRGPVYYDVASFVWQARSRFSPAEKDRLIGAYIEALRPYCDISREEFMRRLRPFVLFRTLQVLGAYGYRGRFEKKSHFLSSIPFALDNLRELTEEPFERYPYLTETLRTLAGTGGQARLSGDTLTVTVTSFSYRKGIPEDTSGNGGGYVFDCRGMHNPGRYEQYQHSTGMDKDVVAFLEDRGEVFSFMDNVYNLVDPHVERYISRGFSHLMVSFGCTGGQHRSVYCAEALAKHLKGKYGIGIRIIHREQGVEKSL